MIPSTHTDNVYRCPSKPPTPIFRYNGPRRQRKLERSAVAVFLRRTLPHAIRSWADGSDVQGSRVAVPRSAVNSRLGESSTFSCMDASCRYPRGSSSPRALVLSRKDTSLWRQRFPIVPPQKQARTHAWWRHAAAVLFATARCGGLMKHPSSQPTSRLFPLVFFCERGDRWSSILS